MSEDKRAEKKEINLLKVCDDREILKLSGTGLLSLVDPDTSKCANWTSDMSKITQSELRQRIEPWLSALFQSEHLSLLVGSGLLTGLLHVAGHANSNGMGKPNLDGFIFREGIEKAVEVSAKESGRGDKANLEDYLRVMNGMLSGLALVDEKSSNELQSIISKSLVDFAQSISSQEKALVEGGVDEKRTTSFQLLIQFLTSFVSRSSARERLNLFTTNYDRVLEYGADLAGIRLIDRFVGSLNPVFRSSRIDVDMFYNPPGQKAVPRFLEGVAHYTKLHGSIDWVYHDRNVIKMGVPFGVNDVKPYLNPYGKEEDEWSALMVYPNASKDRETAEYPYVELFRDFAVAICRPNSTLVTYGYSFGDEHINRMIEDMLTLPSTHLVIIAYNDESGRLKRFYDNVGHPAQISMLVGKEFGDIQNLVKWYLPKASIDTATARMVDIIRNRYEWKKDNTNHGVEESK